MAKKAKIIIIGPGNPYRNGQSIFLAHLCNKLTQNFEVELVNFKMLYPGFLFPGKTQYDTSSDKKLSFPNKRMVHSLNPFNWVKVARYLNRQQPDLIAIDWWHPFFGPCMRGITAGLDRRLRQRVMFITENVISHEANKVDKMLTRYGLKYARCFLALSRSVETFLTEMFGKKVFRSALPIYDFYKAEETLPDPSLRAQFGFSDNDTVLLFFGLVRKYKGLDLLLEAFASLLKRNPNLKLLVVGEFYEDDKPYFDQVQQLGIGAQVHMENRYVPNEEVDRYFTASDCVVLPYRSATQSGILSMAYGFGKPVVVTPVGELGALVNPGKTGFVATAADVGSIEDSIQQYLDQKDGIPFARHIEAYRSEGDLFEQIDTVFGEAISYVSAPL
ncbi:glycosyltransferase [Taibaiella koreensis]|uniref:glycosyltransferase n=1 Tax=Taibaiella koreensis TaxID=1268548 RepID=UPI000E59F85D|nr:glycosyltransferase [Taibaiella koreensis]